MVFGNFQVKLGENMGRLPKKIPSNYIRASPVCSISMKFGMGVAFWEGNKTCFLEYLAIIAQSCAIRGQDCAITVVIYITNSPVRTIASYFVTKHTQDYIFLKDQIKGQYSKKYFLKKIDDVIPYDVIK